MRIVHLLPLAATLLCASAMANVVKCTDSQGRVTYTETGCGKDTVQKQAVKIAPPGTPSANKVTPAPKNWEAENAAFRQRHAEREAADAPVVRPPSASASSPEPTDKPRQFIRRPNPDFPK